jgi:hypothetical protein
MASLIRSTLCGCVAAALAFAAPAGAQTGVRVMVQGGLLPFTNLHAGGQVQVTPRGGNTSFYAEYNQWAWGLVCVGVADSGAPDGFGDDRCSETGYTVHVGAARHFGGAQARWRPYVSGGAGIARVFDRTVRDRPIRASLAAEGGYDMSAGSFGLRLGARWQGRPEVGTDYVGPVIGLGLRF